mmetsp:Transcript_11361/g.43904  ORF Transcript_11361/g.43904 Transcript_11361/m.43904 type:complete len:460 (-) Transcript_11361:217-1596(-)
MRLTALRPSLRALRGYRAAATPPWSSAPLGLPSLPWLLRCTLPARLGGWWRTARGGCTSARRHRAGARHRGRRARCARHLERLSLHQLVEGLLRSDGRAWLRVRTSLPGPGIRAALCFVQRELPPLLLLRAFFTPLRVACLLHATLVRSPSRAGERTQRLRTSVKRPRHHSVSTHDRQTLRHASLLQRLWAADPCDGTKPHTSPCRQRYAVPASWLASRDASSAGPAPDNTASLARDCACGLYMRSDTKAGFPARVVTPEAARPSAMATFHRAATDPTRPRGDAGARFKAARMSFSSTWSPSGPDVSQSSTAKRRTPGPHLSTTRTPATRGTWPSASPAEGLPSTGSSPSSTAGSSISPQAARMEDFHTLSRNLLLSLPRNRTWPPSKLGACVQSGRSPRRKSASTVTKVSPAAPALASLPRVSPSVNSMLGSGKLCHTRHMSSAVANAATGRSTLAAS